MTQRQDTAAFISFEISRFHNNFGQEHEAIHLPWVEIEAFLGRKHEGSPEDDHAIVAALLSSGAPEWVGNADGWVDEYGWGLIGPEIPERDGSE